MGEALGDVLVRGDHEMRPSEAFVHVLYDEIPPEAYADVAIEDFRRQCRRAYQEGRPGWRRFGRRRARSEMVAAFARAVSQVFFFIATPPTSTAIDLELPTSVAVARALGAASSLG